MTHSETNSSKSEMTFQDDRKWCSTFKRGFSTQEPTPLQINLIGPLTVILVIAAFRDVALERYFVLNTWILIYAHWVSLLTPRNILIAFEQVTPVVPQGTFSVMILNEPLEFLSPQKSY